MGAGGEIGPLEQLAAASGREFPNLLSARMRTERGLADRRERLQRLDHDADASVVLMGSWGRAEVTSGSDDDFMVLIDGAERAAVEPSIERVEAVLDSPPGGQGIFGKPVFCRELVDNVGLDGDDNRNLTRRMLFLLEARPITGDPVFASARETVLARYLDESVKGFRPPRFLLNDTVRYWRTMCVDFAGKEAAGSEKWGLRNAKLRLSRKVLFAGGLLPILSCARVKRERIESFLHEQFNMLPTDRIAASFLDNDAADAGARALGAYDAFIGLLDDESFRNELHGVDRASAGGSTAFIQVRQLGRELEAGLLALLFETEVLPKVVRQYAIF